jgi:hypothetical protein
MEPAVNMQRPSPDHEPAIGAQLVTQRPGYRHYGIYIGDGWVVHYAGWSRSLHRGPVQQVSLVQFSGGHETWILMVCNARYSGEDVVRRARSRLGEDHYRLATNNCEHFCAWCVSGESRSEQIERWLEWPRRIVDVAFNSIRALFDIPAATAIGRSASWSATA